MPQMCEHFQRKVFTLSENKIALHSKTAPIPGGAGQC